MRDGQVAALLCLEIGLVVGVSRENHGAVEGRGAIGHRLDDGAGLGCSEGTRYEVMLHVDDDEVVVGHGVPFPMVAARSVRRPMPLYRRARLNLINRGRGEAPRHRGSDNDACRNTASPTPSRAGAEMRCAGAPTFIAAKEARHVHEIQAFAAHPQRDPRGDAASSRPRRGEARIRCPGRGRFPRRG